MTKEDWIENPTVCFDHFVEKCSYSEKSIKSYKSTFNDLLRFVTEHNENLTTANIRIFHEWLKSKSVSYQTEIRYLSFISTVYDEMFNDGAIDENFAKQLVSQKMKVKKGKVAKRLPVALDEKEFDLLMTEINKAHILPRMRTVILILLSCGLRVTELCNLLAKDIHLDVEYPYLCVIGKGNKERQVPIPQEVCNDLASHEAELPNLNGYFVGVERNGQIAPYSPSGLFRMVQSVMRSAGIIKLRMSPHVLRHSYATRQLQGNVPIATLKMWLGHSSLQTTLIYEHSVVARSAIRPHL
jgi:site-specific recombinase XerD